MARSHGRILTSIWSDPDFLALGPETQRMYMLLLSQPGLTHAGTLDITIRRWSKLAAGSSEDAVRRCLNGLLAARFVVIDWDTEELLVRSLIRRDGVWKQPNVMRSARDDILAISSPTLRSAVRVELARLPLATLTGQAKDIVGGIVAELLGILPEPPPHTGENPSGNPSPNPSRKGASKGGPKAIAEAAAGQSSTSDAPVADKPSTVADVSAGQDDDGGVQGTLPGTLVSTLQARVSTRARTRAAPSPSPTPTVSDGSHERDSTTATIGAPQIVAAFVEGASRRGDGERPGETLIKRVGKQAKTLLTEGKDPQRLLAAARDMGLAGYDDLARQLLRFPSGTNVTAFPVRQVPTARVGYHPTDGRHEATEVSGADWAREAM